MTIKTVTKTTAVRLFESLPFREGITKHLASSRRLRSIVYHDICEADSSFTAGLGVTIRPKLFADHLRYLRERYRFISVDNVIKDDIPEGALLLTFDDCYRSVLTTAAPIAAALDIPFVLFINSGFIDNASLAFDNLLAYAINLHGVGVISELLPRSARFASIRHFLGTDVLSLAFYEFIQFRRQLEHCVGTPVKKLAETAQLYLTTEDVQVLARSGVEIGNHTSHHHHPGIVSERQARREILDCDKAIENIVGYRPRLFSYPYGSSQKNRHYCAVLRQADYLARFVVDRHRNSAHLDRNKISRTSVKSRSGVEIFMDLEIFSRI